MFQEKFGRLNEFGWWCMEIIKTDAGVHFTSKEFQEGLYAHVIRLEIAAQDHQEINCQV